MLEKCFATIQFESGRVKPALWIRTCSLWNSFSSELKFLSKRYLQCASQRYYFASNLTSCAKRVTSINWFVQSNQSADLLHFIRYFPSLFTSHNSGKYFPWAFPIRWSSCVLHHGGNTFVELKTLDRFVEPLCDRLKPPTLVCGPKFVFCNRSLITLPLCITPNPLLGRQFQTHLHCKIFIGVFFNVSEIHTLQYC